MKSCEESVSYIFFTDLLEIAQETAHESGLYMPYDVGFSKHRNRKNRIKVAHVLESYII
jgi:hypothetical protein